MRLVIDTNIIIDMLLKRIPFYHDSKIILDICERKQIHGYVTASTISDIFYITRKTLHSTKNAYLALENILAIIKVLTVTNDDVRQAFSIKARDFEDCLLTICAKSNKCDGIVTRNPKDFVSFDIMLYSPEDIIRLFT